MGAELSLVTEHMASALKAKRYREDMNIASVNVESLSKHYIEIELDLLHPTSSPVRVSVKAHVVPNLRSVRPPGDIQRVLHLPYIKGKQPLADPELGGEVDILLGMLNVIKCLRGPIEILQIRKLLPYPLYLVGHWEVPNLNLPCLHQS